MPSPVSSSQATAQSHRCRHVRLNGARCTMPALTGRDLCFDHDRRRRARIRKQARHPDLLWSQNPMVDFVYMEDHASVLANLNAIATGFAHHELDHRQVGTLTYLMQTALKTLRQMSELEAALPEQESVRSVVYDDQLEALATPNLDQDPNPHPENQTADPSEAPIESCEAPTESCQEENNAISQPSPQPAHEPQPEQEPNEPSIPQHPLLPPQIGFPGKGARRILSAEEIRAIPPRFISWFQTAEQKQYEDLRHYFRLDEILTRNPSHNPNPDQSQPA